SLDSGSDLVLRLRQSSSDSRSLKALHGQQNRCHNPSDRFQPCISCVPSASCVRDHCRGSSKGADLMIHISTKSSVVTLINVFTVDPTNQHRLVELLTRATEVSVRHAPGFVSASLHRSLDGTKVTMYAQWRSVEDYQAMRQDGAPLPYLQEALALATFEPGMYEV